MCCISSFHYQPVPQSWKLSVNVCAVPFVRLERLEEDIISTRAGLIILDSVASVVRKEFDTTLPGILMQRSSLLSHKAAVLKYLAHQFNIPVSVTTFILEVNIQLWQGGRECM